MKAFRVYADTSVFGGVHDSEFSEASAAFFQRVKAGHIHLVVSTSVSDELETAPESVRQTWRDLMPYAEILEITEEGLNLMQAYLDAEILTPKWDQDALHVAMATTSGCPMIVSWNFKHIVNFRKIPLFNAVNCKE